MDNYLYKCYNCGKEYKPNRRNKQRFCSNSCRVNSFNKKKNFGLSKPQIENGIALPIKTPIESSTPLKIETMSMAGIGNAVAGSVAVNLISALLTSDENKPATKKDLLHIMGQNKRFHLVKNAPPKLGFIAFYDMQTQCILYQKGVSRG
jgi:hypothetical protein